VFKPRNGVVSLTKDAPLAGSYSGIDPMGLFCSLRPPDSGPPWARLFKKDVLSPFVHELSAYPFPRSAAVLTRASIRRWYKSPGVTRIPVRSGRLRGTLFIPEGEGPFPATIDLFGTIGGLLEFRSALLASRGIASFALAYFKFEDLPPNLDKIDMSYFEEAIDYLRAQSCVSSVAVIGVSLGAVLAVQCAASFPEKVQAAVSISGNYFLSQAVHYKGTPIGHCKEVDMSFVKVREDGVIEALACNEEHDRKHPDCPGTLKSSGLKSALLLLSGDDDRNWCAAPGHRRYCSLLEQNGHTPPVFDMCYKNAGHIIEPPFAPPCLQSFHPSFGVTVAWGGVPSYHVAAQAHAWRVLLCFLRACTRSPAARALEPAPAERYAASFQQHYVDPLGRDVRSPAQSKL